MRSAAEILRIQERLERQMAQLELELYKVESLPADDYIVGDVLMFERRFPGNPGKPYTYIAIKTPNGWYFSGKGAARSYPWEAVLDVITSEQVDKVYVCTEWTEVEL